VFLSTAHHPRVRIRFNRRFKETRDREDEVFDASDFIAIKGIRAIGNKLSGLPVTEVQLDALDEQKEAQAQAVWLRDVTPPPSLVEKSPAPSDDAPKKDHEKGSTEAESGISQQPTLF